jgi:HSP20 family protein
MTLTAYTPMEWQIDRFLNDVLASVGGPAAAWTPRCNVWEDANGFTVKAALPGIDPQGVQIQVEDGVLTIAGERKDEPEEKGRTYFAHEIGWGAFSRSIRLPSNVDTEKVSASYKNGVLSIDLPKREEAKPRRIVIEAK